MVPHCHPLQEPSTALLPKEKDQTNFNLLSVSSNQSVRKRAEQSKLELQLGPTPPNIILVLYSKPKMY